MERYTRTFNHVFATGASAALAVESRNGAVVIRAHPLPEVRVSAVATVHAESAVEAERDFQAIEAGITGDGNMVGVRIPPGQRSRFFSFGRGSEVHIDVAAPPATVAQISARNGRIDVSGIEGPATVESRNGSVSVEGLRRGGSVTSHNGRVEAASCDGGIKLLSNNGSIVLERMRGEVSAETHNGDVTAEAVEGPLTLRSNNGSLRYSGGVVGDLDIEVLGNGSIRLAVPPDSRFILDAEALRGSLTSDLPVRQEAVTEGPRPHVRLRTINGSIRIGSSSGAQVAS